MGPKPLSLRICYLLLLFFGIAAYSNTLNGPFHFDDIPNIAENLSLYPLNPGRLWDYSPPRFITNLSFSFNIYLSGFETWGFHIFNLLIHILNAMIVFNLVELILRTLPEKNYVPPSQRNIFSLAVALLFLSHPIQTQAVTYIVQRSTSLASLFYLGTIWAYLKARLEDARYFRLTCLLAAMAMFTKEISFTLPLAILFTELYFFPPSSNAELRKKILRWLPFAAFFIIIPWLYWTNAEHLTRSGGSMNILPSAATDISSRDYFLTQFRVIRTYLRLLFFPVNQCLHYDYRISSGWGDMETWLAGGLLLAILTVMLYLIKKNRLLSFGILWFFLTLSVESSFIPIADVIFEHRLYLPMFGFSLFAVSLLWILARSLNVFALVVFSLATVLSAATYARNDVWKNKISLSLDALKKYPLKGIVHASLGDAYSRELKDDKNAVISYERALELGFDTPLTYYNLATAYARLGNLSKSDHYRGIFYKKLSSPPLAADRASVNQDPIEAMTTAIQIEPENPYLYIQLGKIYHEMKQREASIASFRKAINLAPLIKDGYEALALLYNENGEKEEALAVLLEYLKFKKKHAPLFGHL